MPDVHWGMGATVGSVIPTHGAIIPAAVGVDIGCGMMAVAHEPARRRSARQPRARSARGDRGGGAARPHRQRRHATIAAPGDDAAGARCRPRGRALEAGFEAHRRASIRSCGRGAHAGAPRHARHRQPLHRALPRRGGARLVHAALAARAASATGSAAYFIELAKQDMRALVRRPAGRGPRLPAGGHRALRRLRARR